MKCARFWIQIQKPTPLNQLALNKNKILVIAAIAFIAIPVIKIGLGILIWLLYGLDQGCKEKAKFYCPLVYGTEMVVATAFETSLKISDFLSADTDVLVEDDKGNIREGVLKDAVASSRKVKKGDKIRLACHTFTLNKITDTVCELQFSGFDRQSPYPRDNPLYGVYVPYGVSLDDQGNPRPGEVLRYKSPVLKP